MTREVAFPNQKLPIKLCNYTFHAAHKFSERFVYTSQLVGHHTRNDSRRTISTVYVIDNITRSGVGPNLVEGGSNGRRRGAFFPAAPFAFV